MYNEIIGTNEKEQKKMQELKDLGFDNTYKVMNEAKRADKVINLEMKLSEIEANKRNKQFLFNNFKIGRKFLKNNKFLFQIVEYDKYFAQYKCKNLNCEQVCYFTYDEIKNFKII